MSECREAQGCARATVPTMYRYVRVLREGRMPEAAIPFGASLPASKPSATYLRPCRQKKPCRCGRVKRFSASEEPLLLCNNKICFEMDPERIHFTTYYAAHFTKAIGISREAFRIFSPDSHNKICIPIQPVRIPRQPVPDAFRAARNWPRPPSGCTTRQTTRPAGPSPARSA